MKPFQPSLAIAVAVSIGAHAAAALYLTPRVDVMQAAAAPAPLASPPDAFGRPPNLPAAAKAPAIRYLASLPPSPDGLAAPRSQLPMPAASAALPARTLGADRPAQTRTRASAPSASGTRPSPPPRPAAMRAIALETPMAIPTEPRRTMAAKSQGGEALALETPQASPVPSREAAIPDSPSGDAMASYLQGVHGALQSALRYPAAARGRNRQGQATLDITLSREGRLLKHRLYASSGHASLDDASLQAARKARFAPAPPDLPGESFRFRVPLRFRLDGGAGY